LVKDDPEPDVMLEEADPEPGTYEFGNTNVGSDGAGEIRPEQCQAPFAHGHVTLHSSAAAWKYHLLRHERLILVIIHVQHIMCTSHDMIIMRIPTWPDLEHPQYVVQYALDGGGSHPDPHSEACKLDYHSPWQQSDCIRKIQKNLSTLGPLI
jgi:hypothetical protein